MSKLPRAVVVVGQGSSFPPMGGGEVGFAKKLPPHGGDPGGEVSPPMGERLGGKLRKF